MFLLDADILIDVLRDYLPAIAWISALDTKSIYYLPGYAAMEVLNGCRNKPEAHKANQLIKRFNVCWAPESACDQALFTYAAQHLQYSLGVVDALIAATTLAYDGTLFTFNCKHYQSVEGLKTHQPYFK